MIRSTKTTLKFAHNSKKDKLVDFICEYQNVVKQFCCLLWDQKKLSNFVSKDIASKVDTWLSARMLQCAGKQASAIIRGTQKKQKQRLWRIDKLKKEGNYKKAKKLQRIYNSNIPSSPTISSVSPELDSRFVSIDLDNKTSFDGWITLSSIGNKLKIKLPFKKTKHFNKLLSQGKMRPGIRVDRNNITFIFEIADVPKKTVGNILGVDIGQKTTLSCSNGVTSKKNKHGYDLSSITTILSRKKRGSNGFKRASEHRKNYIHWTINQLNLDNIKQVNIEQIKNLRKGKTNSRKLGHWTYSTIFDKLESYCEEQGVLVNRVNPTYTSQRCSQCGWTRKRNRKGKLFKCEKCNFEHDSDLNASLNIAFKLPDITRKQRLMQPNRKGFYWNAKGQESIVPAVHKHSSINYNNFQ
jgi:IS605 OrfB family transposase